MPFFKVKDVPSRRVVQYARVASHGEDVIWLEDVSVLGDPVDEAPFAEKTGLSSAGGMLYEVSYLPDSGDVYFSAQPESAKLAKGGSVTLHVEVKAGKAPYSFRWFREGKEVVSASDVEGELTVAQPGSYFCAVTDADGAEAVSKAAAVE